MLILRRRVGERIVIDGAIIVWVYGIEGDTVKVGVDAPRAVHIAREELLAKKEGIHEREHVKTEP